MKTLPSNNIVLLGANSDIGRVFLQRALARPRVHLVAVSRSRQRNLGKSRRILPIDGIDLTKEADLERVADAVGTRFREPFSVIHSVGDFWEHKPLVKTPFPEIEAMLRSQTLTLFGVARFLTPVLIRNGGGRLVAFSCNSVGYCYPDMAPFTASKAAVEVFLRCYAHEHSTYGIAASSIALPTIRTRTVKTAKPTGDHKNYITPEALADYVIDHVLSAPLEETGNTYRVFKHSHTFYNRSYYDRNPVA